MKRLGFLAAASVFMASPALAAEWWHGSYMWDIASGECGANDSSITYWDKTVKGWEHSCTIDKITNLVGLKGVILNLSCTGEGEDLGKSRTLLLDMPNGKIASYPDYRLLRRCDAPLDTAALCPSERRVYRAEEDQHRPDEGYQELQFSNGVSAGEATITKYLNDKIAWSAKGLFACSNGAVICSVEFKGTVGDPISLPFEVTSDGEYDESTVVIPAFRQSLYYNSNNVQNLGKAYSGLAVTLAEGFIPKAEEVLLPQNVYKFSRCGVE